MGPESKMISGKWKMGNFDIDTQMDHKVNKHKKKRATNEPKREAWNRSFSHRSQKINRADTLILKL